MFVTTENNRDISQRLVKKPKKDLFSQFLTEISIIENDEKWLKLSDEAQIKAIEKVTRNMCYETFLQQILVKKLIKNNESRTEMSSDNLEQLVDQMSDLLVSNARNQFGFSINENNGFVLNKEKFSMTLMKIVDFIFVKETQSLFYYDTKNGCWYQDSTELNRLIHEIFLYCTGTKDFWSTHKERMVKNILRRQSKIVSVNQLDFKGFPFKNKTLDMETLTFVDHSPDFLCTLSSQVEVDEQATCPKYKSTLEECLESSKAIEFFQEWIGYQLYTTSPAGVFEISIGTGGNGKSALHEPITKLVGKENCAAIPLDNFNTPFGLQPLIGKKVNLATESGTAGFQTAALKAIVMGEEVSVNIKNQPEITMTLPVKLSFLVNELPQLTDLSYGLERRLIILPFNKVIVPEKQNINLTVELEQELSGILNFGLEGLRRLKENKFRFTESDEMKAEKKKYFAQGNPVLSFVKDKIKQESGSKIERSVIFAAYNSWLNETGLLPKGTTSANVFWREFRNSIELEHISTSESKTSGTRVFLDIAVC